VVNAEQLVGRRLLGVYRSKDVLTSVLVPGLGAASYFAVVLEVESLGRVRLQEGTLRIWDGDEELVEFQPHHDAWHGRPIVKVDMNEDQCQEVSLDEGVSFFHCIDYGDQLVLRGKEGIR